MFPIRDHNPSTQTPYVTYALIAINVAVFLSYWPFIADPRQLQIFFYDWAMTPVLVSEQGAWSTLFTSMFLHGGWMHLAGNMLFLWIFGDNLEEEMGHVGYLLFYIASGVGAAAAHLISAPYSQVPTVGASGGDCRGDGRLSAAIPQGAGGRASDLHRLRQDHPGPGLADAGNLVRAAIVQRHRRRSDGRRGWPIGPMPGGFVFGLILTLPLFLKHGGPAYWNRTHGHPPHPEARYTYRRSDIPRVRKKK